MRMNRGSSAARDKRGGALAFLCVFVGRYTKYGTGNADSKWASPQ